jgi:hypothetical protein
MTLHLREIRHQYRQERSLADRATRNILLGAAGLLATLLLVLSPDTGTEALRLRWIGVFVALTGLSFATVPRLHGRLRRALLAYRLKRVFPLELDIVEECDRLGILPPPVADYVERVVNAYAQMGDLVRESDADGLIEELTPLGEAHDNVLQFLELAAKTRRLKDAHDDYAATLSQRDAQTLLAQYRYRCDELRRIMLSFERSLSHLVMAHVTASDLAGTSADEVKERMGQVEEEMETIRQSLCEIAD